MEVHWRSKGVHVSTEKESCMKNMMKLLIVTWNLPILNIPFETEYCICKGVGWLNEVNWAYWMCQPSGAGYVYLQYEPTGPLCSPWGTVKWEAAGWTARKTVPLRSFTRFHPSGTSSDWVRGGTPALPQFTARGFGCCYPTPHFLCYVISSLMIWIN